jgi:hypothetical protein
MLAVEGDNDEAAMQGDLDVTADLAITGLGVGATIIDGAWASDTERIFDVIGTGTDLSLLGLTVQDGDLGLVSQTGGGVRVASGASLTMTDGAVTNGKIVNQGGGGIYSEGTIALTRVAITGNASDCCGGLWNYGGTATLTDVLVANNESLPGNDSGGVFNDGTMTMDRVLIVGNSADYYGGLGTGNSGATLTATNVTVSGNEAAFEGGGIGSTQGDATFNNVTVTGNTADADNNGSGAGGGIFFTGGSLSLENSILSGNTDRGGESPDCSGAPTSQGHNLIGSTAGCAIVPQSTDKVGGAQGLGPLADNGGFTQTHALLAGSPAVDAGGSACAPTDQRGVPRTGACDIGAYELALCLGTVINRVGTAGNDVLVGTAAADGFLAQQGNDVARGLGGNDRACLGPGNDLGAGGGGKDRLAGEQGKDRLKGQGGNDRLKGGPGNDTCVGGPGKRDRAVCEVEKSVP